MSLPSNQRILLEKDGKWTDRTESIRHFSRDGKLVRITFQNGRTFNYGFARVATVGSPSKLVPLPIVLDRISQKQLQVASVEKWVSSDTGRGWFRLHPLRGRPIWRLEHDVELQQDAFGRSEANSPRAYLTEMADAVQSVESGNGDDEDGAAGLALRPKLEKLAPIPKSSVLGSFLTGKSFKNANAVPTPVIAPWATNLSQLTALQAANSAPISVIQGPPGTGKTQTILALIANALIRGGNHCCRFDQQHRGG